MSKTQASLEGLAPLLFLLFAMGRILGLDIPWQVICMPLAGQLLILAIVTYNATKWT